MRKISGPSASILALVQAGALIVFASWALGGRAQGSPEIIAALGWLGLIPLFLHWREQSLAEIGRSLLWISPWIGLFIVLIISWWNPLRVFELDEYGFKSLVPREPLPFLPVCFHPVRTGYFIAIFTGALITSLSAFHALNRRDTLILLGVIAINGAALSVAGAVYELTHSEKILGKFDPVNPYFYASFRYYNHWVGFAILSLGAACAWADSITQYFNRSGLWLRGRQRWDLAAWTIALALAAGIPLCGSRSGLLLSGLFLLFAIAYLVVAFRAKTSVFKHLPRQERRFLFVLILASIAAIGSIETLLVKDTFADRWKQTIEEIDRNHVDQRFYASPRDCFKMLADRPVWGWGLGSYYYAFLYYAGPEYRHPLGAVISRNEYAHHDWMQYTAELGIVGMLLLLSVPATLTWRTLQLPRIHPEGYWLALGCGLFLFLAAFEFPLGVPANVALFPLCFAISARLSLGYEPANR